MRRAKAASQTAGTSSIRSFVTTAPPPDPEPEPTDDGAVLPTAAVTPPATDMVRAGSVRHDDLTAAISVAILAVIGGVLGFVTHGRAIKRR